METQKTRTPPVDKYPVPKYLSLLKMNTNKNWSDFFNNPQKHLTPLSPLSPLSPVTPHTPNSISASNEIYSILSADWRRDDMYVTVENDVIFGSFELEKCSAPALEFDDDEW